MPIVLVDENTLPPSPRRSKIATSEEWGQLTALLRKGFPGDKVVRVTFDVATKKLFKDDGKKVAIGFVIKLRGTEWNNKYRFSAVGEEVRISHRKDKSTKGKTIK